MLGTISSTAKAGIVAGVEGTSSVTNGFGMFGYSTAATGGIGANGRSDSSNGVGLQGVAIGTSGIAVNAVETSTSGTPIGVVAKVSAPTATGALITNVATGTVTGPLISATTNAGTQFTVGGNGNVSAAGSLSGKQLISTVATGTAPLQVASTTLVPNLNASLLGGKAASAFALASGSPNYIQNGTAVQPSANFNISGTGTATSFNSVTSYQIGGGSVLSIGSGTVLTTTYFSAWVPAPTMLLGLARRIPSRATKLALAIRPAGTTPFSGSRLALATRWTRQQLLRRRGRLQQHHRNRTTPFPAASLGSAIPPEVQHLLRL